MRTITLASAHATAAPRGKHTYDEIKAMLEAVSKRGISKVEKEEARKIANTAIDGDIRALLLGDHTDAMVGADLDGAKWRRDSENGFAYDPCAPTARIGGP